MKRRKLTRSEYERRKLAKAPDRVKDLLPVWANKARWDYNHGELWSLTAAAADLDEPMNRSPKPYRMIHMEGEYRDPFVHISSIKNDTLTELIGRGNRLIDWREVEVRAYDRLLQKIQPAKLELGMDLATYRETAEFVFSSSMRAYKALMAIRHGHFNEAASFIGLSNLRHGLERAGASRIYGKQPLFRKHSVRRTLGDLNSDYLAWTYAAEPLMGEVATARNWIDNQNALAGRVHVTRRVRDSRRWVDDSWGPDQIWHSEVDLQGRLDMGAIIIVDNPNKALLSQLGLANPLTVLNDLIPFSFVVNYWTGHEQWLASFDVWAGLKVHEPWVTKKTNITARHYGHHVFTYGHEPQYFGGWLRQDAVQRSLTLVERPGITERFELVPFHSLRRAMNFSALLLTFLRK